MSDQIREGDRGRRLKREGLAFFGAITASLSTNSTTPSRSSTNTAGSCRTSCSAPSRACRSMTGNCSASPGRSGPGRAGKRPDPETQPFAHSTDSESREIDLGELLADIVGLSQRLAGLRMMQLELRPGPEPVRLVGNPFSCSRRCSSRSSFSGQRGGESAGDGGPGSFRPGVRIVIAGTRTAGPEASGEQRELLGILMEELRGEVEIRSEGDAGQAIVLTLSR